jgi:hypothetical protein
LEAAVSNVLAVVFGLAIGLIVSWLYVLFWKARYTAQIRGDAVQRSQAVLQARSTNS